MINWSLHKFHDVADRLMPFFRAHAEETDPYMKGHTLDPHWDMFFALSHQGRFLAYIGEDGGKIVAYACFAVSNEPHYKGLIEALVDNFYVVPEYRKQGAFREMVKKSEAEFKNLGVSVFKWVIKNNTVESPLEDMGFPVIEKVCVKVVA